MFKTSFLLFALAEHSSKYYNKIANLLRAMFRLQNITMSYSPLLCNTM